MLIIATLVALSLALWAFLVSRHEGTPRRGLRWLIAVLLATTGLGWLATIIAVSGSIWALATENGASRDRDVLAGLSVLGVAGFCLLTVCAVAFFVLVAVTWNLNQRLDRKY